LFQNRRVDSQPFEKGRSVTKKLVSVWRGGQNPAEGILGLGGEKRGRGGSIISWTKTNRTNKNHVLICGCVSSMHREKRERTGLNTKQGKSRCVPIGSCQRGGMSLGSCSN